jgi:hypothetical protein
MESGFPQPDVDPTPDMVIGAALLVPRFSDDLSPWRMTIGRDGAVRQELRPTHKSEFYDLVCFHLHSYVTKDRVSAIERLAEEIGFDSFGDGG